MERVTGIGGFFFTSHDPDSLGAWYAEHLGVDQFPTSYDQEPWTQQAGATIFAPMHDDEPMLADTAHGWMLNFRVADLNAMVTQLRSAGIEVEVDSTEYPNGIFASLDDPDGNPIQLWEPRAPS